MENSVNVQQIGLHFVDARSDGYPPGRPRINREGGEDGIVDDSEEGTCTWTSVAQVTVVQ